MSLSRSSRPRRDRSRLGLEIDRLEPRGLLSATTNPFASFQGQVGGPEDVAIAAQVRAGDFGLAVGGRVTLRIVTGAAGDGRLDPGPASVGGPGQGVRVLARRLNVPGSTDSVTIASVRPGPLTIRPQGQGGSEGDFALDVSLAGDVDGNFRVDNRDLKAIRNALGRPADAPGVAAGADVNGDGRVGPLDLVLAIGNRGAATSLRPAEMTAGLAPGSDPDGDGLVDASAADLVGRAAPGATVRVDRGGDGTFEATAIADASGAYRVRVPLNVGANPIAVESSGSFGQEATVRLAINRAGASTVAASYDFTRGDLGWSPGFADLPLDANASYELDAGLRNLPPGVGEGGTGFLLQGHNRSDDLFMFLKKKLGAADGIRAGQTYEVRFRLTFASNSPSGAVGIGGAPGEAVALKAGAGPIEPAAVPASGGYARLNIDKGDQSTGGPAASVAGDVANGQEPVGSGPQPYVTVTKTHTHSFAARADADGNLWLLVGTDSGFEGLTAVYFQRIDVELAPIVA